MSTLLSSKDGVKARKPYWCTLCGDAIEAGTLHDVRTGANGDGIWTMRMHPECQTYEQTPAMRKSLMDWFEDVTEPAFHHADALAYVAALPAAT